MKKNSVIFVCFASFKLIQPFLCNKQTCKSVFVTVRFQLSIAGKIIILVQKIIQIITKSGISLLV